MKMDYLKNIELALALGFEEVLDENAYKGKYYVKGGKIWIHDISALKAKLKISEDLGLIDLNYDVSSYYKYLEFNNEMVDHEIYRIKAKFDDNDSVLLGRYDFMFDPNIIEGMVSLADEGFDDEILYDYAHQMSKR